MRIYRYFFFALLFAFGIIMTSSELVMSWQDIAPAYPTVQFRFTEQNREEAVSELAALAEKYSAGVFVYDSVSDGSSEVFVTYYSDSTAQQELSSEWKLRETVLRDSAAARYNYHFSLEPIEKAAGLLYYHDVCITGEESKAAALVREFTEYARTHFEENTVSVTRTDGIDRRLLPAFTVYRWLGSAAVIIVMTAFEVAAFRKEAVILLTGGCSVGGTAAKRLLTDALVYSVLLAAETGILIAMRFAAFAVVCAVTALGLILLLSAVIYLSLFFSDVRAVLGDVKQGAKVLAFNWLIKGAAVTGCLVLSLSAADTAARNRTGSDTEALLRKYFGGYSYSSAEMAVLMTHQYDISEVNMKQVVYDIYRDHYYDLKPLILAHSTDSAGKKHYIRANHYALEYLRSQIPELASYKEDTPFCLLLREGNTDYDVDGYIQSIKERFGSDAEPQVIYYRDRLELVTVREDTATGTGLASDPVITVENYGPEFMEQYGLVSDYSALILDDASIDALCARYGMRREDMGISSVAGRYESHFAVIKAAVLSQIMLAVTAAAAVLIIGASTVKYTFLSRAKELCLMKLLGHSTARRYLRTFVTNGAVFAASFLAALVISNELLLKNGTGVMLSALCGLLAADTLLTLPCIIKQEQASVQKILKGGAL